MAYADEGVDQRMEVQSGPGSDSLVYYAKANGAPQTVDVGTAYVTVMDPNGSIKVDRTATTIAGGGRLVFPQVWPLATYPLGENYSALWEWQVGGVSYADRELFDVVLSKLPILIDTSDLEEVYPNLLLHLKAINATDGSRFIKRAWSMLLDRIRSGGYRPSLILDRARLINPAIQLSLGMVAEALARETGDLWHTRAANHVRNYEQLFGGIGTLSYDVDQDGTAQDLPARINRVTARV